MSIHASTAELSAQRLAALRKASYAMRPTVQVGKGGLTPSVVAEIKLQLKKHKLVKIKLLKGLLESTSKNEALQLLVSMSGGHIVHKVGFVIVLYKD